MSRRHIYSLLVYRLEAMSTVTVVDDLSFMIKARELAYCRNFKLPLWEVQQAIIGMGGGKRI